MMKRLIFVLIVVFGVASVAVADDFPTKPITHIIPAKAGGGFDRSSRVVAVGWEKILGQPIKFSYLAGASGMIGFGKMMSLPADGYTTIMTTIAMQAMNINVGASKYDWKDIGFVGNLIVDPNVMLVHKDSPWKTIDAFIEAGRKAEKPLTISTSHPKAVSTLAAKIFIKLTGINAKPVPFDGGSKARDALAGKHVDVCIGPYFSASSKKEFLRALASFKAPDAYKKLVATFRQAIERKETQDMAKQTGMAPFIQYWSPEKCDAYVKNFQGVWEKYKDLMK